jgi:hypothetical protein
VAAAQEYAMVTRKSPNEVIANHLHRMFEDEAGPPAQPNELSWVKHYRDVSKKLATKERHYLSSGVAITRPGFPRVFSHGA